MFSNLTSKIILFSGLCSLICCSNDHNFKEEKPVVSLSYDSNCLGGLGKAIELYTDGLLSEREIKKNFKCVIEALDYVQVRVRGEKEGVYSSSEVKNFLNKFLYKDSKKSLGFYERLLVLKGQIFGGAETSLSFEDLKVLKVFLKDAEKTALEIKPYASEIFFQKAISSNMDAAIIVKPFMGLLKKWILFRESSLSLKAVFGFLNEAEVIVKAEKSWAALLNLLRSKDSSEYSIEHNEKIDFVDTLELYYTEFLSLYGAFETDWEYNRTEFSKFSVKVDEFLLKLNKTIEKHPKSKWGRADLVHFMNLFSEYEVLGEPLSVEIQEHVVDVVFGKWFPTNSKSVHLSAENFQKLILSWKFVNDFVKDTKEFEGFKGEDFPFVREGLDPVSQFTQRKWPSLARENRTVLIPDYSLEVEFSFQSLFHSGWQFLAAKILIESYKSEDADLSLDSGINIDQVKEAYIDVFLLLKEVGFLDEESRGSWFRIFNEGNLFVPTAKPDGFVSYSEAADYAAYMFSAYNTGSYISDLMEKRCPDFAEDCSFNYVLESPKTVFESLPGLGEYFSLGLDQDSYKIWKTGFEYIAKLEDNDDPYEKSHWFRGSVANQYTEVIYRKYDLDSSDTLDFAEVSLAYIDFKEALKLLPMIKGTKYENDDPTLKTVLTWFVDTGSAPSFTNGRFFRTVKQCGEVYDNGSRRCKFESERPKIMALLAYLTSISEDF